MESEFEAVALSLQFGSAALLVVVMTLVHGVGLATITKILRLEGERLEEREFDLKAIALMCGMALLLFALHLVEIFIFAGFYLAVGALEGLEESLYFSASTYATLGRTEEYFPADWRLLGSLEAIIGFLLIGWSTAFIVSRVNKLRK